MYKLPKTQRTEGSRHVVPLVAFIFDDVGDQRIALMNKITEPEKLQKLQVNFLVAYFLSAPDTPTFFHKPPCSFCSFSVPHFLHQFWYPLYPDILRFCTICSFCSFFVFLFFLNYYSFFLITPSFPHLHLFSIFMFFHSKYIKNKEEKGSMDTSGHVSN